MILKCISTGSDNGNCYVLKDKNGKMLLLDLGCSEKTIKQAIDFQIKDIVGCLVTHHHMDHAKSVDRFRKMGLNVFTPYEKPKQKAFNEKFNDFKVVAFPLDDVSGKKFQHTDSDGTECPIYGFYITHPEIMNVGPILYITDCCYIKYTFSGLSTIILGVDYQEDLLDEESAKFEHQIQGHMSIDTCCKFLSCNNSFSLTNVVIGHLSEENANDKDFVEKIQKVVKSNFYIARKNLEIKLGYPFG